MEILEQVISTLTKQQIRNFRYFLTAYGSVKDSRKDVEFLNTLVKNKPFEVDHKNSNAYHHLRKRLLKKLENYIVLLQLDQNNNLKCIKYDFMAKKMLDHDFRKSAHYYTKKALQVASKDANYDLLNYASKNGIDNMKNFNYQEGLLFVESVLDNLKSVSELAKARIACSLIRVELMEAENKQVSYNLNEIEQKIFKKCEIKIDGVSNPVRLNWALFVSTLYPQYNQSKRAIKIALETYYLLIDDPRFSQASILYSQMDWLVNNIAYIKIKLGDYDKAIEFAERLEKRLLSRPKAIKNSFPSLTLTYSLFAHTYFLMGDIDKAQIFLQKMYEHTSVELEKDTCTIFDAHLQFAQNQYENTLDLLVKIQRVSANYETSLGTRNIIFKEIFECLVHYDLENYDVAQSMSRSLLARHEKLLKNSKDAYLIEFLLLVKQIVASKIKGNQKNYDKLNQKANLLLEENKKYTIVYIDSIFPLIWLKSKINDTPYYQELISNLKESRGESLS